VYVYPLSVLGVAATPAPWVAVQEAAEARVVAPGTEVDQAGGIGRLTGEAERRVG
jgi:hypothetical protein